MPNFGTLVTSFVNSGLSTATTLVGHFWPLFALIVSVLVFGMFVAIWRS